MGSIGKGILQSIYMAALVVGIAGFVLVGVMLVLSTLVHLDELWAWSRKGSLMLGNDDDRDPARSH